MMLRLSTARPAILLLGGFLLWAVAFLAIYMTQAAGCGLGWDAVAILGTASLQRAVLVMLFVMACALHLILLRAFRAAVESESRFTLQVGRTLALSALAASVFCFAGVVWLTPC